MSAEVSFKMNPVLQEIFETKTVTDGIAFFPLDSNVSREDGLLIERAFREVKPALSLEVGMAYGISTLFICDAITAHRTDARHIVIDPFQRSNWRGIGIKNVVRAGYERFIDLHEVKSEIELPSLLAAETEI